MAFAAPTGCADVVDRQPQHVQLRGHRQGDPRSRDRRSAMAFNAQSDGGISWTAGRRHLRAFGKAPTLYNGGVHVPPVRQLTNVTVSSSTSFVNLNLNGPFRLSAALCVDRNVAACL